MTEREWALLLISSASWPFSREWRSPHRIQKLREGHQRLPLSGVRVALPVGGGLRDPKWFREDFRMVLELRPVVAGRLPLTEARRAHELLENSAAQGKLMLVP